jgi:hypothetical protein
LERSQTQRQKGKSDHVQTTGFRLLDKRGIFKDPALQERCHEADWNIYIESPPPGDVIGKVAAQSRPNYRRHNNAYSEHSES